MITVTIHCQNQYLNKLKEKLLKNHVLLKMRSLNWKLKIVNLGKNCKN